MVYVVAVIVVAVVVSVAVVAAAASQSPEGLGLRSFVRDLRSALARRRSEELPEEVLEVEPVDASLEDLFASTPADEPAYVEAERLASRIEHVVEHLREEVVGRARR